MHSFDRKNLIKINHLINKSGKKSCHIPLKILMN